MKTSENTVLITGGSAGIGFEIAKLLSEKGSHVIITGRNKERLDAAAAKLSNVTAIQFDVTNQTDVENLVEKLKSEFPRLNVLINNAGNAHVHAIAEDEDSWKKAEDEMQTNYVSVLRLTDKLLPLLRQQENAAIVNVTSVVAIAPAVNILTYSASKAALRSYSQGLRLALKDTSVRVYELMPPLVNTSFSEDIGGKDGISPVVVAEDLIHAFEVENYEIHVGDTAQIFELAKQSPVIAFNAINGIAQ